MLLIDTTASKTATVETLTAEVRALMVGSRQITLSVYKQLDFAPANEIEPFGRVRPNSKGSQHDFLFPTQVVGRDKRTGHLVRSEAECETQAASEWRKLPLIVLAGLR